MAKCSIFLITRAVATSIYLLGSLLVVRVIAIQELPRKCKSKFKSSSMLPQCISTRNIPCTLKSWPPNFQMAWMLSTFCRQDLRPILLLPKWLEHTLVTTPLLPLGMATMECSGASTYRLCHHGITTFQRPKALSTAPSRICTEGLGLMTKSLRARCTLKTSRTPSIGILLETLLCTWLSQSRELGVFVLYLMITSSKLLSTLEKQEASISVMRSRLDLGALVHITGASKCLEHSQILSLWRSQLPTVCQ